MFIFRIICRPRENLILGVSRRESEKNVSFEAQAQIYTSTRAQTHNLKPEMLCEWSMLKDWLMLMLLVC